MYRLFIKINSVNNTAVIIAEISTDAIYGDNQIVSVF